MSRRIFSFYVWFPSVVQWTPFESYPLPPQLGYFLTQGHAVFIFLQTTFCLIPSGILDLGCAQNLASDSSQNPNSVNFLAAVSAMNNVTQRILSTIRVSEHTGLHKIEIR